MIRDVIREWLVEKGFDWCKLGGVDEVIEGSWFRQKVKDLKSHDFFIYFDCVKFYPDGSYLFGKSWASIVFYSDPDFFAKVEELLK